MGVDKGNANRRVVWKPHKGPQTEFLSRGEDEVLYGGARGGGKSEAALMGALRHVNHADYKAIFFRRTFPQVQDLIDRARILYKKAFPSCRWQEAKHRFLFSSGATVMFSHMERELDHLGHTGKEYQYIAFEELTYFQERQYKHLLTCSRSSNPKIKPIVVATTNPGGIGHLWVKNYFIDPAPHSTTITNEKLGLTRVFIPAKVTDNPTLMKNDPRYILKLKNLPDRERKMQLEGLWDVFEGQFFSEWNNLVHVVSHREPSVGSLKFIAIDWGYARPFSVGWYEVDNYDRIYKYREWYGVKSDEEGTLRPNIGIETDAFIVAEGIKKRTHEKIDYIVEDPHMEDREGHGASIADDFRRALPWPLIKGNNNRLMGKNQVHARLRLRADGRPGLTFSDTCFHTIRTLQALPASQTNPEDADTKAEDHCYDELRYGCMSQPTTETLVSGREGIKTITEIEPFRFMRASNNNKYGLVGSYV